MKSAAKNIRRLARDSLPRPLARFLRRHLGRSGAQHGRYFSVRLTDRDVEEGSYKECLGGGAGNWESRGAFQLHFLREMGMVPSSKVLDVGCGPGRAARHLIAFLEDGNYCGVDYNPDFIRAASAMAVQEGLDVKHPAFEVIRDFDFAHMQPAFDYAIVFSVLNHCGMDEREAFFKMIHRPLKGGGRIYISHARWFEESCLEGASLRLTDEFGPSHFDITRFGWKRRDEIFPIVELTRS